MNDTKAINRIKADLMRQLMEMKLPDHKPVPVVEPEEEPEDKWPEYEAEHDCVEDYDTNDEEAYMRDVDERYYREKEAEIERMIKASEDARNYLKAIEEFND